MQWMYIFIGGLIGLWFGSASSVLLGFAAGAAFGYLLEQIRGVEDRVKRLNARIERLIDSGYFEPSATPPATDTAAVSAVSPAAGKIAKKTTQRSAAVGPAAVKAADARKKQPDFLDKLVDMAKDWLTTGNVPVKLGVIVSFFGVAFLLRYAVDQGLIVISIETRYLAVTVAAAALLGLGWKLRQKLPVYALSLQGGGIGILYLTIFAAFRLHQLVPPTLAFSLLVLLTAFSGVLAVLQNSLALATLGTVGGFLAPVLVSTGSGNHVALFSYYLLLNAAILGIAWYRPWRALNVIGFAFTFGVGTWWGYEYYRPELFASTEPFLVAFFLFYQAIAVLFAFRQPPKLRGIVDGTLVFGTPVIAFALQYRLVNDTEYGLAISAVVLAVLYTLIATWLHRLRNPQFRLLIESFIALGVAFATIAVPLALDGRWSAVAWSLEGAALVWISVRQQRVLARLAGSALLVCAGIAFAEHGWRNDLGIPVLNGNVLAGLLISLASLNSARYLALDKQPIRWQSALSAPLLLWGLGWWLGTGIAEIFDRVVANMQLHAVTAYCAVSVALVAWVGRRDQWTAARRSTLAFLPILPLIALVYLIEHKHLLAGIGTLSWMLAALAHFGLLWAYDNGKGRVEAGWHFAGVLILAALIAYEVYWRIDEQELSIVWSGAAAMLVPVLIATFILFARERIAWPLQRYWNAYLGAAAVLIIAQLLAIAVAGVDDPGNPAPLRYLPVLNPLDVLTIVGLAAALQLILAVKSSSERLAEGGVRLATIMWSLTALALTTIAVVRGVHHLGDVPWQQRTLANSVSVQSALSIYWAVLGFGGMICGARYGKRWVWMVGTGLMVVVVIKLFMIDLGNTGTVARIVSFLGVGALLLVVGYFAPAPPREAGSAGSAA
ncbi:MAG: DUF2339 domain-containing protein [Woeseiaceae bacterium]|nr:DUF2339 domain-containing protein [Woeseiaceae bacterium]